MPRYNGRVRVDGSLNLAAFLGWLACSIPGLIDLTQGRVTGLRAAVWSAAFLVFGAAYGAYLRLPARPQTRAARTLALTQAAAGFTMVVTAVGMTKYLCGISLTIVAGELPLLVSARTAWTWSAVQSVALAIIFWQHFGVVAAISAGGAFAGFHLFAIAQALVKRELHETRELLAETSRNAERVRISRDLHDTLGHHLTGLSIQLDVAARRVDGPAAADIREAHAITRLLLSDVRSVVSQLRQSGPVDLMVPLRSLAASAARPQVHIDGPATLMVRDPAAAETVQRSIQEIITNAVRHSAAENLWIAIKTTRRGIELDARDDGRGAAALICGNGLTGMRERFAEAAGSLEFTTAPGRGFQVHGVIPHLESTS
jgi:signal transduction histidine kinase